MNLKQQEKKELFSLLTKYTDSLMKTITASRYPYKNDKERSLCAHANALVTHLFTELGMEESGCLGNTVGEQGLFGLQGLPVGLVSNNSETLDEG